MIESKGTLGEAGFDLSRRLSLKNSEAAEHIRDQAVQLFDNLSIGQNIKGDVNVGPSDALQTDSPMSNLLIGTFSEGGSWFRRIGDAFQTEAKASRSKNIYPLDEKNRQHFINYLKGSEIGVNVDIPKNRLTLMTGSGERYMIGYMNDAGVQEALTNSNNEPIYIDAQLIDRAMDIPYEKEVEALITLIRQSNNIKVLNEN